MNEEHILDLDYASRVKLRNFIDVFGYRLIRDFVLEQYKTAKVETRTVGFNFILRIKFGSADDKLQFMMKYL